MPVIASVVVKSPNRRSAARFEGIIGRGSNFQRVATTRPGEQRGGGSSQPAGQGASSLATIGAPRAKGVRPSIFWDARLRRSKFLGGGPEAVATSM